jgi:hypothetical protein
MADCGITGLGDAFGCWLLLLLALLSALDDMVGAAEAALTERFGCFLGPFAAAAAVVASDDTAIGAMFSAAVVFPAVARSLMASLTTEGVFILCKSSCRSFS